MDVPGLGTGLTGQFPLIPQGNVRIRGAGRRDSEAPWDGAPAQGLPEPIASHVRVDPAIDCVVPELRSDGHRP